MPVRFRHPRHARATPALQAGVHPKVVVDRLDHSSVKMTLVTFSHAMAVREKVTTQRVAALVFAA